MSVDRLFTVPSIPVDRAQLGRDRASLEGLKAEELAREFESMMLLQMLRQMRQSMLDESVEGEGLSASTWLDTIDSELARQLSKAGGVGLAEVMAKAIREQSAGRAAAPGATEASPVVDVPTAASPAPTPAGPVPGLGEAGSPSGVESSRMTSAFGWRADPFTGALRYHRGIDVKAAYGQEVPAAAPGVVVEAGERGAYGLTVLIEHESGVRTRYAHLSAMAVGPGDRVLQGQGIGRVGQSGRATGPHLHFEVIRHGQRVDPSTVVALQGYGLGGLKLAEVGADSAIGGHAHTPTTTGVDDED